MFRASMDIKNQLCACFAFSDVTWKKMKQHLKCGVHLAKRGEEQMMVLHGAAPHSKALLKPRCGLIQWLGQHSNRNSRRTALLSVSDHPVQPVQGSPLLLWGLLSLTEEALGAQRDSFFDRKGQTSFHFCARSLPLTHFFLQTFMPKAPGACLLSSCGGLPTFWKAFVSCSEKAAKVSPFFSSVCLQMKNKKGNELISALSVTKF